MKKFRKCMKEYISQGLFNSLTPEESADKLVSLLEECGYKAIACDFDSTIIEMHSGGYLDPNVDRRVLESVTPDFKALAKRLKNSTVSLFVVTYSDAVHVEGHARYISGDKMISAALKYSNCDADIKQVYAYYPRFWDSPSMYKRLGLEGPMPLGKEYHLKRICSDHNFTLDEIILIDDDMNNCRNAESLGVTSLHVTGEGLKFIELDLL
ncbi:p36 (Toxoplasma gondii) homologue, putative [Theileria annulata]|uniref:p36 (Toxoplasma gondii) homologue, putative n=1 Tax=Theileria annulata TaxID=5874 RepID=Q4UA62_THEAN|nr:p36 (Toxoplasma gondii) homologue, putative [Theileria annulata]CAI76291.1 p36 (Toxoplasma gondii) homologue, putative [Theileria annulata]|eukprot:XP_952915.1 p36 (Toxoplasma gondii) homologue, putative [Theileria annulata]